MLYDLIIVGTGPAGLSAALYAGRYKLKIQVFGAEFGGSMAEAWKIENFPGFKTISGAELAQKLKEQLENLGIKISQKEIVQIKESKNFKITTKNGEKFESKALILALGTQRKKLNVPGEDTFFGKGVSYCATCDGLFFQNKIVAVVGGGDSAIKTALLLTKYAKKTYLLVRGEELTGEPTNIEMIKKTPKMEIMYGVNCSEIRGKNKVESVILDNKKELKTDGVFIEVGTTPASALIKDIKVGLDEKGFIKVDENQRTNIEFVYAAGDVSTGMGGFKQVLTAAAQGAVAATSAYKDLTS